MLVIFSSWRLLSESVSVLMESAPGGINVDEVRDAMAGVKGVSGVHDLHVWTITSGLESLSAHVVSNGKKPPDAMLRNLRNVLRERFPHRSHDHPDRAGGLRGARNGGLSADGAEL